MQFARDAHETPYRYHSLWWGIGSIDQRCPFQRSVKGTYSRPFLLFVSPTAIHTAADGHETPTRPLFGVLFGLGVGWIDHFWPFHRAASVRP